MAESHLTNLPAPTPAIVESGETFRGASLYARTLHELIDNVLAGELDVAEFCEAFGDYYLEHKPDLTISRAQAELFASVQQKIDWTDAEPTPKARHNGWLDYAQFLAWLRQRVIKQNS